MEQRINKFLSTYENCLIWKFMDINDNRHYMYGKCEELDETFFVFHKNNDKYFIDIGCCYEYGDFDYGRFDFFNYEFEITRRIELKPNFYESLIKEIDLNNCIFGNCIDDYEILDNSDSTLVNYESIKTNNVTVWYKMDDKTFFVNGNEKMKFVDAFIKTLNI